MNVRDSIHEGLAHRRIPAQIEGVRTALAGARSRPALASDDLIRAIAVKDLRAPELMDQPGILGVGVGRSEDNPGEPALVVFVEAGKLESPLPAEIDGVRTRIVEGDRFRAFGWGRQPASRPVSCSKKISAVQGRSEIQALSEK